MKFSFIVPTVNHLNMTMSHCLGTFEEHNGVDHEVIVVDDGSDESIRSQLRNACHSRGYVFDFNVINSGFAKTVNKGIAQAKGDIVVLVNNDIKFIQPVVQYLEEAFNVHQKIGIVGGLLLYPDGSVQHGGIERVSTNFTHRGWHKPPAYSPVILKPSYLIGVTGALFAIRKSMIDDIGMLNEDYFLSCEDTEYCIRAWRNGWRVYYSSDVKAIHEEGGTRGNTVQTKIVKGRSWLIKEMNTAKKFSNLVANLNMTELDGFVNEANLELLNSVSVKPKGSERMVFDGSGKKSFKENDFDKKIIGVVRTGALGDVLLTTGIISELKRRHPDKDIWVSTGSKNIFKGNPNVANVVSRKDQIPSNVIYDLDQVYERSPKMHIAEAYANAVFGGLDFDPAPELFSDENDYQLLKGKISGIDLNKDKIVIVHMAQSWPTRTWSRQNWMAVTRSLASAGNKVVVVGKGGDFVADLFKNTLNLVNNLSIHEIRELMQRANVFIGMDSGLFHVAMTTSIPVVGLFTVASPEYRVSHRQAKTIALVPKVECRFCLHEEKPPVTFVGCKIGTMQCLSDITSDEVVRAASEVMT